MTDLKDEIAEKIRPFVRGNSVEMNSKHAFEAVDVAIETIIARIPPLVWDSGVVQYARSMSGAVKYVVCLQRDGTASWWLDARGEMVGRQVCDSEESAKAAANAHHVAQLCKGMGIE